MSAGAAAKSIDLDQWFDLYQGGTTKARAIGGGIAGANLSDRYANVIYGSQGPATGIQDKGVDICTLYAQKGTASYALPIDGQTYGSSGHAASGLATAAVILNINNTQYELVGSGTGSPGNTWPFNIPAGVTQYAYKINSGAMSAWSAIPSSGTFVLINSITASSTNQGTVERTQTLTLYFGTGGTSIYSGICTMTAVADSGS